MKRNSLNSVIALSVSFSLLGFLPLQVLAETLKIKEGTVIDLTMNEGLSSKTAMEGQVVPFTVYEDIKEGETVLIKAGTKAMGTITKIEKAGALGKAGELGLMLERTYAVDNTRVPLRASMGKEGNSKRGLAVGLGAVGGTIIFLPLAFFMLKKGQDAAIPAGARMKAYVDQDVQVEVKSAEAKAVETPANQEATVQDANNAMAPLNKSEGKTSEAHSSGALETSSKGKNETASSLKALLELRKQNLMSEAEFQDKLKKLTEMQK